MTWQRLWLLAVLLLVGYFGGASGAVCTSAGTGNWNAGVTQNCGFATR